MPGSARRDADAEAAGLRELSAPAGGCRTRSASCVPQVHGTAVDAVQRLGLVLDVEINAPPEKPLLDAATEDAWHNANLHTGYLAHALDPARAAVYPVAELSAARLGDLVDPDFTGLRSFLADGPPGSSGVLGLEYVAQDGVASLRHTTLPATLGSAVISRGLEDHASYSTHAARLATVCVPALRTVLAVELVAAVRAGGIRMDGGLPAGHPLAGQRGRSRRPARRRDGRPPAVHRHRHCRDVADPARARLDRPVSGGEVGGASPSMSAERDVSGVRARSKPAGVHLACCSASGTEHH